jgi:hypothetical protein
VFLLQLGNHAQLAATRNDQGHGALGRDEDEAAEIPDAFGMEEHQTVEIQRFESLANLLEPARTFSVGDGQLACPVLPRG